MRKYRIISVLIGVSFSVAVHAVLTLDDFPPQIRKYMSGIQPASSPPPNRAMLQQPLQRVSTILPDLVLENLKDLDLLLSHTKSLPEVIEEFQGHARGFNSDNILADKKGLLNIAKGYVEKYRGNDEEALKAYDNGHESADTIMKEKAIYRLVIAMILDDQKILQIKRRSFGVDNLVGVAEFIVTYNKDVGDFDEVVMENFLQMPKKN